MITFPNVNYYYQQAAESIFIKKSIQVTSAVAFHVFHILKYEVLVPAAITSFIIAIPLSIIGVSLFAILFGINLACKKICHLETMGQFPPSTVERLFLTIHLIAKYCVRKIPFVFVMATLSPYIVVTLSIDYIEDVVTRISQLAIDTLNIPVQLNISRRRLMAILDEWKGHSLPGENRESACQKILACYDHSNDLVHNILSLSDYLYLDNCGLTDIPNIFHFKPFSKVNTLFLNNNRLTYFPAFLFTLPNTSRILIRRNQFSEEEIHRILLITSDDNYQGPMIDGIMIFDAPEFFVDSDSELDEVPLNFNPEVANSGSHTIDHLYTELCRSIQHAPQDLSNLAGSEALCSWLNRLNRVSDYTRSSQTTRRALITNVIKYLEEANENGQFRNIFTNVIQDASETCGDRVALSILHLDIAYQLANIDSTDMVKLSEFLFRGCLAIELLEECARQKVQSMPREVDEIEVYLGYPIHLKRELNLPISQETMLYFRCSLLTPEDLATAKDFVLSHLNDPDTCLNFLINHDIWKSALVRHNREAFNAIEQKKMGDLENIESEADYAIVENEYNRALKELSAEAIGWVVISPS